MASLGLLVVGGAGAADGVRPSADRAPAEVTCAGESATIVATQAGQVVTGADGADVISSAGLPGVVVRAGAGADTICGAARAMGGVGDDSILVEQAGVAYGGPGDDQITPTIDLEQGAFVERPEFTLRGGPGDDVIDLASPRDETGYHACGRQCRFELAGDAGTDTVRMVIRNDDEPHSRVGASLYTGKIKFWNTVARVATFENVEGSPHPDIILGSNGPNRLDGRDGNDLFNAYRGDDVIIGGPGDDKAIGGAGDDVCRTERRDPSC